MQLALVNGSRVEAYPTGRGVCPICAREVVAKCGTRVIHHWAHSSRRSCDPWWEPETQWHRDWKNLFPVECREVSHRASDGEIHRADIKTPTGIIIEVQHSMMNDAERTSREQFYGNLIWVVDGAPFRENFDIYHALPDPTSAIAHDLVWSKAERHAHGANKGIFFRLSEARKENPEITKREVRSGWVHWIEEIQSELSVSYIGHHQFDWVRPRGTWLDAACPVYIDFHTDLLVKLETYDDSGLRCVRLVSKRKLVHDVMVEQYSCDIATRFCQLPPASP